MEGDKPTETSGVDLSVNSQHSPRSGLRRLAWLPIPLLIATMGALWVADVRAACPLPALNWLVHYGSVALGIALIVIPAARSFLASGRPSVLMLGCAVLMSQIGAAFVPALDMNLGFAIYNTSVLLSALCHFTGIAVTSQRRIRLRPTSMWLTAAYAGGMATMGLLFWAASTGRMPDFFIEGQGGTVLRDVVVSTAVALFLLTAGLLWQTNRRSSSSFFHWYALGLVLVAAGLMGSMAIIVRDSPLQWVTRSTQILGMVYMCVAVLASIRENSAKGIPLEAVEDAWQHSSFMASFRQQTPLGYALRYGLAVAAVAAAMGLRATLAGWVGPDLPTYITFYPAVMVVALLGGLGPGLVATAIAGLMVTHLYQAPVGHFNIASPVDRLGLVLFACLGLFMSVVAEFYRHYRQKAATYERELALHRSREALRDSEDRYRSLFNGMTEGFAVHEIITDQAGTPVDYRFLDINPAFERLTGLKRKDVIGKTLAEVMPGEDTKWIELYGKVALTGEPMQFENHSPVLRKHFEVLAYSPAAMQFAVVFVDITRRKEMDRERDITMEFLRLVNASTGTQDTVQAAAAFFQRESGCEALGIRLKDGDDYPYYETRGFPQDFVLAENHLCTRDPDGKMQRDNAGNPCIACMCGNVICGRIDPAKPFFSANGSFWTNNTTQLLATTTAADRQANTRNRCNGQGYESVALIPLHVGGRPIGLVQLNDKRKGMFSAETISLWERLAGYLAVALAKSRAEETLRQAVEDLKRSNQDLEQFAYISAHDLQEPLRQVRAFISLLQDRHADKLDSDAARYFQFVCDGASRMSDLIRGLLDYSRVGASHGFRKATSCQQALDTAIANLQAGIDESLARITHDQLPTVLAEPTQLCQLFQNLIGNAIKFRISGVPPVIHVGCTDQDGRWLLSVKDNGIGIATEHHDKAFMIFQRLHSRDKYSGTGIGLAICKRIVEQHGGKIWIESKPGEGSTFHFSLPKDDAS